MLGQAEYLDARWPDGRGPIPVGTRREPWSHLDRGTLAWLTEQIYDMQKKVEEAEAEFLATDEANGFRYASLGGRGGGTTTRLGKV